jgi:hypothetical protein
LNVLVIVALGVLQSNIKEIIFPVAFKGILLVVRIEVIVNRGFSLRDAILNVLDGAAITTCTGGVSWAMEVV